MRLYLDTSALVKLYVAEEGSQVVREALAGAELVGTSAIAYVEAIAALARRSREGGLSSRDYRASVRSLHADWPHYLRVDVTDAIIRTAARAAKTYALRADDAVHLTSALVLKRRLGGPLVFGCWDAHLQQAARRVGLRLLKTADHSTPGGGKRHG